MHRLALLGVVLLLAAGCARGPRIVKVSGRVLIDGKAAANVHVAFEPIGSEDNPNPGSGSVGITDSEGVYRLTTVWPREDGAVVGNHRVLIHLQGSLEDDDDERSIKGLPPRKKSAFRQLPRRYNEATELTCEVPAGGTDRADFSLNSR